LGCDEIHELFGKVYVRALEGTTLNRAVAVCTGDTDDRLTGARGRHVVRVTDLLEAVRAREVRKNELSERLLLTVGVVRSHRT